MAIGLVIYKKAAACRGIAGTQHSKISMSLKPLGAALGYNGSQTEKTNKRLTDNYIRK